AGARSKTSQPRSFTAWLWIMTFHITSTEPSRTTRLFESQAGRWWVASIEPTGMTSAEARADGLLQVRKIRRLYTLVLMAGCLLDRAAPPGRETKRNPRLMTPSDGGGQHFDNLFHCIFALY